ncbi:PREDICTED: uncharacterized protein LOC109593131 [Amphimedon queenslandica]|uniref:Uncharacterized protein n=1 Tax=Amphimedon queenslandica TaxID=400682 RepID=A0AAN0K438_AMPQE|nr:PREDICTED: uncharacterized protein LOC109593131 [Amphimedon queenslandica]|eukprot:XP_019863929.1 PREDICTED: uncharacterized protein LOC109593131 [Amphimedon queenslandica]
MANLTSNESSSNDTELSERDYLIRGRGRGMRSNGGRRAAGFGRSHAYERSLGRGRGIGGNEAQRAAGFRRGHSYERTHGRESISPDFGPRERLLEEQSESDNGPIQKSPTQLPRITPVRNIISPKVPNYDKNEDDETQNDRQNPTPTARCNNVRLKENEYPIRRHCFHDCTKKIFRNRKKCAIIPLVLAFVFMVIFIVCILRITEMYWYYHFGDGDNNTKELFIPVESVVDVDLTSLNISTIHDNKLNVTIFNKSSLVRIAIGHDGQQISLPLKTNITLGKGQSKSILRYWKSHDNVAGTIKLLNYEHHITIGYKWGNMTHPPHGNCSDHSNELSGTSNIFDISKCFLDSDRGNNQNIIHMHICHNEKEEVDVETIQTAIIDIDITESYVLPNKESYKSIYNDDTVNQNSAVLQFPSLLSELQHPSSVYINTFYPNTNGEDDNEMNLNEVIKLDLKPQASEDDMEIIETVALVITAILSLLLSLMMFGIGIRCCCCHIKTGFYALGLFYEEQ